MHDVDERVIYENGEYICRLEKNGLVLQEASARSLKEIGQTILELKEKLENENSA